jgi:hypothetical protein
MSASHYVAGLDRDADGRLKTQLRASRAANAAAEIRLITDGVNADRLSKAVLKRLAGYVEFLEGQLPGIIEEANRKAAS